MIGKSKEMWLSRLRLRLRERFGLTTVGLQPEEVERCVADSL